MIFFLRFFVTLLCVLDTHSLQLPKIFSSDMVLQAENPTIYGFTNTANATVVVTVSDTGEHATGVSSGSDNLFTIDLKPRVPSFKGATITVTEVGASSTPVTLKDVLFGDVWICSGQSNMEFAVAEMLNATETIRAAAVPGLRLFAVQKNASGKPTLDLIDTQYTTGWVKSSPETICGAEYGLQSDYCEPHCASYVVNASFKRPTWGYFSAVCFVHGLELARAYPDRPFGLVESCWGGTTIESWSSGDALKSCDPSHAGGLSGGVRWNSMVIPLLNFPIKGTVWYQGEANSKKQTANAYACQMKALIRDWRARWRYSSNFTFGIVQLAPAGDSSQGILRWSQYGATIDPLLVNVGMSVAIDLYDKKSPCGAVHIRNKTAVGNRMARASLALAYGHDITWSGPIAHTFKITETSESLLIGFTGTSGTLTFRNVTGQTTQHTKNIQITSDTALLNGWKNGEAFVYNTTYLNVNLTQLGGSIAGVRYAWANTPTGNFMYGGDDLPAGPFIARCNQNKCVLVPPGKVPIYDE